MAIDNDTGMASLLLPPQARRLLRNGHTASVALCERGAVLYCDLSGFSRMGARAIALSERGAEDLRAEINAVFDRVSRSITGNGGSLLYYAGDAVAAFWPDGGDPVRAVNAAIAAGHEVQKDINAMEAGLSMRTGVAFGDLWLLDLATRADRRLPVFCGSALETLDQLELHAAGVALCPAARRACDNGQNSTSASEPTPQADGADFSADLDPAPWLGPHHRAGLVQGAEWLAEFRQAHVLFARLPCPQVRCESDALRVGDAILAAVAVVEAEGGTLLQVCQDDKGLVLVAAWQLASSGWEDGAERAVLAAQRIASRHCAVAVAGGKVFAGLVGGDSYQQYVVVGDAINRAAAMAGLAPQPVTLDEATAQAAARRFETARITELPLKGQERSAPVFAITAERLRGIAHAGALVGRTEERARLQAFAERVTGGERTDMVLVGDAGLGKSRLAHWLEGTLDAAGGTWRAVKGDGIRRTIGYSAVAPMIRDFLGLTPDSDTPDCRRALALLGPGAEPLLPLLNPVLPVDLPETEASRRLTQAGRAGQTRDLMAQLLSALLPDGAVIIADDAHWLDSATWQLLEEVSRTGTLSLVLVMRPITADDLPSEARRYLDDTRTDTIHLGPLPEAEAGALAAQALGADVAAQPLAAFLYAKAAGHPLFTTALALTLATRDLVRVEAGFAHLHLGKEGLATLTFPTDVASAVQERIAALSPSEQLTLKTCAVLGRNFDEAAAAELHPSSDIAQLRADLREIEGSGLVERTETGWRFHHAIITDAAHATLTSDQARRLHAAAAQRIARLAGDDLDQSDLVLLAHHSEGAGENQAAVRYLTAAAANARASYANLEVVEFLTRATALAGEDVDPLTLARWRYDIAHALRALGQYQRTEDFLKRCITDLDRAPPETNGQAIRGLLGGYLTFRLRPCRAAQPEAQRAPVILAADATMMLSEIHYELNKIAFALAEILRGANLARRAGGDSATLAKLYIGLSLISTSLPRALDGDALQEQALDIAGRLDDPATEAWVLMVSGNYESGKGGWRRGAEFFLRSMQIAEAAGEHKTWETAASTMGNLKRLEGHFQEAKSWSDITLAHSRDRGIVQGVIWSHNGRARDLLCLSEWQEMRGDVEALERLLTDPANALDANDNNKLVYHYTRAALELDAGNEAGAIAALDAALAIVARTKRPQIYMTQNAAFYCDLIRGLWARGHQDAAMAERQSLVTRSAKRVGRQYRAGVPMEHLAAGDAAWIAGKPQAAGEEWRASARAAEERGMFYNAAHALDRLTHNGLEDHTATRDRYLADIGIVLPRLWRLES